MPHWIEHSDELACWLDRHAEARCIGLDTEFLRTDTFRPRLALVQLRLDDEIALLDAPRLDDMRPLAHRLSAATTPCVMHGASEDLEALAPILPMGPAMLFDTQLAAAFVGLGYGLSYQKLVASVLGVALPKGETRSDWFRRPLRPEQLEYASQDVAHLPELHSHLDRSLTELGRSAWLAEDCQRLVARLQSPPDPQPQHKLRAAARLPLAQQALLRRLLLWRDTAARLYDKPRGWILDDARAMQFASHPPRDEDELNERCRGLRALRGRLRQELWTLLRAPLGPEERDVPPIPPPLGAEALARLAALREAVATIAERLGLAEALLCPRRHLETLLTERQWPAALEGWRKPLLYDALMTRLD
jgi:ribonuclease D